MHGSEALSEDFIDPLIERLRGLYALCLLDVSYSASDHIRLDIHNVK